MKENSPVAETEEKPKCLVFDCEDKATQRGLCEGHRGQFQEDKKIVTKKYGKEAAKRWEEEAIAKGLILPKRQGNRPKKSNPFKKHTEEFISQQASLIDAAAKQHAEDRVGNTAKKGKK